MVYVFLAHGFEEIEAVTAIDILRREESLDVVTAGIGGKVVEGAHQIRIGCDIQDSEVVLDDNLEMIVLPGGLPSTLFLEKSPVVQQAIDFCMEHNKFVGAICAAPSILGHKGLLKGKEAVCYQGFEEQLLGAEVKHRPVAVANNIITGKGAGVAVEFSLTLLAQLKGQKRADIMRETLECF